jgi:hydrogenase-4 membrane subunit HyfE
MLMNPANALPLIVNILAFAMLLMALGIASAKTVGAMIRLYQAQSAMLALVTLLTAVEPTSESNTLFGRPSVALVLILPLVLAVSIEALLARATVPTSLTLRDRIDYWLRDLPRQARPIWLEHGASRRSQMGSVAFNLILTAAAYVVAFKLVGVEPALGEATILIDFNSLAVSLALLLVGLSTLSRKEDIISQITGLLVMEHGMFLAAIKVIVVPSLAIIFVISLFVYIIITLTILVYLLPELHRASGTIEVSEQQELKG